MHSIQIYIQRALIDGNGKVSSVDLEIIKEIALIRGISGEELDKVLIEKVKEILFI